MAKKRNGRQDAIREIVRTADVRTQRMLVDELKACGFDCTQATVSRDIADMGLHKLPEGMYVLAEDLHLQRMVSELVIGVPVGFVHVVEAKELFLQSEVPHIVARGRKGGSNVAAAICNALLYLAGGRTL